MPVQIGDADDVEAAAEVLAEAFMYDPPSQWLIPNPADRPKILASVFELYACEPAAAKGGLHIIDGDHGIQAVAAWIYDAHLPAEHPHEARLREAMGGGNAERWDTFGQLLEETHPTYPHDHLALIGVTPAAQGRGLGSALLAYHQTLRTTSTAYLEASSTWNLTLYERQGFTAGPALHLPDGPPLWPMWRQQACQHTWAPDPQRPLTRWRCTLPTGHDQTENVHRNISATGMVQASWTARQAPDSVEWMGAAPLQIIDPGLGDLEL